MMISFLSCNNNYYLSQFSRMSDTNRTFLKIIAFNHLIWDRLPRNSKYNKILIKTFLYILHFQGLNQWSSDLYQLSHEGMLVLPEPLTAHRLPAASCSPRRDSDALSGCFYTRRPTERRRWWKNETLSKAPKYRRDATKRDQHVAG